MSGAWEVVVRLWSCPSCVSIAATDDGQPGTPMHRCAGMSGLTVPYVPEGERARHVANDRQDYLGVELVQRDAEGRVVMSVTTQHWDGSTDCTAYAPCASVNGGVR